MGKGLPKLPTLRELGIAVAVAGVAAFAAPFAWRWFWPTPIATIDEPDAGVSLQGCFVTRGRVLPSTIWKPLWLIDAWDGSGWRPLQKIDPSAGTWQAKACVHGRTRGQFRLALVVADRHRDDAFRHALETPSDEAVPAWLTRRRAEEQCAGAHLGRSRRGFDPMPDGAMLVASVVSSVLDGDEDDLPCITTPLGGESGFGSAELPPLRTDNRTRHRRHDERRVTRGPSASNERRAHRPSQESYPDRPEEGRKLALDVTGRSSAVTTGELYDAWEQSRRQRAPGLRPNSYCTGTACSGVAGGHLSEDTGRGSIGAREIPLRGIQIEAGQSAARLARWVAGGSNLHARAAVAPARAAP